MKPVRSLGLASLASIAAAAAIALGSPPSLAAGGGYAHLEITGFQIRSADDSEQLTIGDFSEPLAIGNNGEISANLASEAGASGNIGVSGGALDLAPACQGPSCPFGNDNFAEQGPGGHFARSDQFLSGASVNGGTSVTASTVAEVVLDGGDLGGATGSTGTITTFGLSLEQEQALRFEFDAEQILHAYLDGDTAGNIEVSTNWSLTIEDDGGNVVFAWTPDGVVGAGEDADDFDLTTSRAVQLPGSESSVSQTGHFEILTQVLTAGTYTLSVEHITRVAANITPLQVPEPAVLLLLGLGLLGVGYLVHRRDKRPAAD